jgi:hypothetical protein
LQRNSGLDILIIELVCHGSFPFNKWGNGFELILCLADLGHLRFLFWQGRPVPGARKFRRQRPAI